MFSKIVDVSTSVSDIKDDSIVAISGFNMATTPEYLILELYKLYNQRGHPRNVFIISDALPAVPGRALDQIAKSLYKEPGQEFLKGALMPFLGFSPWLQKLVTDNRIECYGWPIGVTAYWFREIASGRPGLLTKIGVDTFLDPRQDSAALNELAKKNASCHVSVIDIDGEDYLLYQAPKPNYAMIRASVSDEIGNLSLQDEGMRGTVLSIAQAAKAGGSNQGKVIAQVRWMTKSGTINPRDVDVPGPLVNYIVVSPKEYHWQCGSIDYDPRLSYKIIPPATENLLVGGMPKISLEGHKKVIARRILLELIRLFETKQSPVLVNLGIGIPALISLVAAEEKVTDFIITVLESGPWGGLALGGNDFGLAVSPFALSTMPDVFSNFEGGIIDAASLGFLEVDKKGNVNPSMLPNRIFGPGGFPVIAGGVSRIYFAGSFTGGKSDIIISDNGIRILHEGTTPKFIESVYKIVFSGHQAIKYGQEIMYITERAVFKLTEKGLVLEEVAPGIDLNKDVISKMSFAPIMGNSIKQMDTRIFSKGKMGIRDKVMQQTLKT
ncbi:MAG TPA: CoA-transferase [Nitrososphaeraceae archaeon]|nr:CoA-transferase [Nitrososphaeraceae archaeon]